MTRRKRGRIFLCVGAFILLLSLLLIFNTTSPWAIYTLVASVIINTTGLAMLLAKNPEDD